VRKVTRSVRQDQQRGAQGEQQRSRSQDTPPARTPPAREEKQQPQERKPPAQREPAQREQPAQREPQAREQPTERPKADQPALPPRERSVAHRVMLEEERHRDRMARLARLRELAVREGWRDKVARIDALQAKEERRYAHVLDLARKSLSKEAMQETEGRIREGRTAPGQRTRGAGDAPPERKPRGESSDAEGGAR
jgi:hypothetical protein